MTFLYVCFFLGLSAFSSPGIIVLSGKEWKISFQEFLFVLKAVVISPMPMTENC